MIGYLKGTLVEKQPPALVIDVNGIGYEVEAPMSTFYVLPAVGEKITLHTHLHVREDAQLLFGFATKGERSLFKDLIRISGVGAKLALTVLSGMNSQEFVATIQAREHRAAMTQFRKPIVHWLPLATSLPNPLSCYIRFRHLT